MWGRFRPHWIEGKGAQDNQFCFRLACFTLVVNELCNKLLIFLSCSADAWSVVVGRRCQISPCARLPPSHYAGWNALGRGYLLHPAFGGELFPATGRSQGPFACCGHLLRATGSFAWMKQLGAECVCCRQRGRCTFEQTLSEIIWGMQGQLLQTPSLEFFPAACISIAFYQNVSSFSCRSKELACKLS
jgi:hypothetical protein